MIEDMQIFAMLDCRQNTTKISSLGGLEKALSFLPFTSKLRRKLG